MPQPPKMKYTTIGNCPFCDSERGMNTPWGMSPNGMAALKAEHDAGHPNLEAAAKLATHESKCCSSCLRTDPTSPNNGDFSKFCVNASCSCHQSIANFLQVGRAVECGHCNPKYAEGMKHTEEMIPGYKCECVCHDHPTNREDWEKEFDLMIMTMNEPKSNDDALAFYVKVKDFIRSLLLSQQTALRDELCKKIEGIQKACVEADGKIDGITACHEALEIVRGKE